MEVGTHSRASYAIPKEPDHPRPLLLEALPARIEHHE